MPEIGTADVNSDELDKLIDTNFSEATVLLEKWFCGDYDKPDWFNYLIGLKGKVPEWDKGRIFDAISEIRWQKEKNVFHLVWIKDEGNIPEGWEKESINRINSRKILLWGVRITGKNGWYEKQIARIFEYPVKDSCSRVYMELNEYNGEDGLVYYRFKGVKA